jgi:hypothetical protein
MSRFNTQYRHFRPMLETLEAKDCPSVTLSGTTLIITGDNGINNVVVTQNDEANTITVVENNGSAKQFKSSAVSSIVVSLKDGADSFTFKLGGTWDFLRAKNISVDLGVGQDTATFDVAHDGSGGDAEIDANLSISVSGKGGADKLTASLGRVENASVNLTADLGDGDDMGTVTLLDDFQAGKVTLKFLASNSDTVDDGNDNIKVTAQAIDLDAASTLDVDMAGGRGMDTLDFLYSGNLDGLLKLRSDGGKAQDTVKASIALHDDSDGSLDAIIRGGEYSRDTVALALVNESSTATIINAKQLQD